MAQSAALQLPNTPGASFREGLNELFEAILTGHSGPTAPAVTYPFMFWVDTSGTSPVIRQRNAADSAWLLFRNVLNGSDLVALGSLSIGAPVVKAANFTVAASENWLINNKAGASCVVTLPDPATNVGRILSFVNRQAQTMVSASSNVVPQSGGVAGTAILPAIIGVQAVLVSDGSNWLIQESGSLASAFGASLTAAADAAAVRTLLGLSASGAGYQEFTTSGTWTKPAGISADALVIVEGWGAGGGGSRNTTGSNGGGGGGGGAYSMRLLRASDLGATETISVGAGGVGRTGSTGDGTAGGNSSFGSWLTAYGGAGGTATGTSGRGGGGGGQLGAGSSNTGGTIGGGDGAVDAASDTGATSPDLYGGSGGGAGIMSPTNSVYGGAGGGGNNGSASAKAGGTSKFGGNGGAGSSTGAGTAGSARGGGGGAGMNASGGDGGRGEIRVWVIG